jgi:putative sterol carrier protein
LHAEKNESAKKQLVAELNELKSCLRDILIKSTDVEYDSATKCTLDEVLEANYSSFDDLVSDTVKTAFSTSMNLMPKM